MPPLADLVQALKAGWRENTRRVKGRPTRQGPRDYLTASNLSECGRAMALDLLHPEDNPPFDDDVLERFYRGDDIEATKVARLHQVGLVSSPPFRVTSGQKEVEIFDRRGTALLIRGKIEGTLDFYTERIRLDFEIKSGDAVRNVESLEDMLAMPWTRKYLRQFLAYLYAQVTEKAGNGQGVFILDRPGLPVMLPIDLAADDRLLELAETTLVNAEAAVNVRFGLAPLPPFIQDASVCRQCVHLGKSCHPEIDFGAGAVVDDDPTAAEMVRLYLDTKSSYSDHERVKRYLFGDGKKPGRYREHPMVLVGGDYLIEGGWKPLTTYAVPEEVKEQYKDVREQGQWKTSVRVLGSPEVKPQGSQPKDDAGVVDLMDALKASLTKGYKP